MKKPASTLILTALQPVCLLTLSLAVFADDQEIRGHWTEHTRDRAWLEQYDPTLFSRRVFSEFSFENHDGGKDFYKIETTLRAAIPIHEDLALGLQMMIPLKWSETPASENFGTGDLELRTGFIGRLSPALRYGFGVNAVIESASDSALSSNAFILRPIFALRWDAAERLNLGTNVEYNFTPFDEGSHDVSALEVKFPVAFKINGDWSAAVTFKPRWNFLSGDDRNRLALVATFHWGSHNQYAVSFGGECPLSSESLDYKLLTGFAWCF